MDKVFQKIKGSAWRPVVGCSALAVFVVSICGTFVTSPVIALAFGGLGCAAAWVYNKLEG